MNDILQYLVKWSIALAVVFLFYRIALRPLTFYQWNRRYLIMYSLVAFLIPFINLNTYVQPEKLQDSALVQFIPAISIQANQAGVTEESSAINILMIAGLVILAGSLLLSIRLAMQWYSLHRIRRQAVRVYHPEATVYHVDEHVIPFSFGSAIYLNTSLHTEQELNDIILHEFVHVRQKHSFDIIWSEILCILNWYNPFAWCIRHAIRQNLEFIADQAVLQHGLDKKKYQYHLLKVIGSPQYSIANNFNFSSLKKRIAMMNRLKSARVHLVKFLFVLPLLAILLVAFRQNESRKQAFQVVTDTNTLDEIITDTTPRKEAIEVRIVHLKEFYKMNPDVKEIAWSADEEIVVYLRNGQREAYRLQDDDEMKKYRSVYKAIPSAFSKNIMPPAKVPGIDKKVLYMKTAMNQEKIIQNHLVENENVENVKVVENIITIKLKNGTVEKYDMENEGEMERFEKKYGKVPPPPPFRHEEISVSVVELPEGVLSIETEGDITTVIRKDGTTEKYDLGKTADRKAMEKKYGQIIVLSEIPIEVPKKKAVPTAEVVEVQAVPSKIKSIPSKAVPSSKSIPEVIDVQVEMPSEAKPPSKANTKPAPVKKTTPAKSVIHLEGDKNTKASVRVIHQDNKEQVLYADKISVHTDLPEWKISPKQKPNPVYYLNGKRATVQDPNKIAAIADVSHMEIVSNPVTLKINGEAHHNAIINIITKENTHNTSAYLADESKDIIEKSTIESKIINTLLLDEDNPIDIKVEGLPEEQIEVDMTGGQVFKKDGRYYARPKATGNVMIRVYRKEDGKERKLINKRVFRVVRAETPVT